MLTDECNFDLISVLEGKRREIEQKEGIQKSLLLRNRLRTGSHQFHSVGIRHCRVFTIKTIYISLITLVII